MDIVAYTKFSVEDQMAVRRHYYALVGDILSTYCEDDFVTLDAGDGMAVCYTGDPEDVLIMAINLRDAFVALQNSADIKYKVRLGINLGPVKIVELQGEKRVIGDAVNVANRVMSFAGDNQLLVSRSYYDVVANVSSEYVNLFNYLGLQEDKHVRKHAVYEVSSVHDDQQRDSESVQEPQELSVSTGEIADTVNANAVRFEPDALHSIEAGLAFHVGPLARILVKRAAEKAANIEELCLSLAQNIADERLRTQFLESCRQLQ